MVKLKKCILFDLDQTLVDSSRSEYNRKQGNWHLVYQEICRFHRYPGVRKTIQDLKSAGWKVGIVTSSPRKYAEKVVKQFDLKCDTLICFHDTYLNKPNPDPYVKALKAMKVKRAFAFAVGDTQDDIDAANELGIISIWARWGINESYPDVKNYDSSFDNIYDLGDLILNRRDGKAKEKRITITGDSQGNTLDELVRSNHRFEITGGPARFYKYPGWFLGENAFDCPICHLGWCETYRAKYTTTKLEQKLEQYYWAFVCLCCHRALEPKELPSEIKKILIRRAIPKEKKNDNKFDSGSEAWEQLTVGERLVHYTYGTGTLLQLGKILQPKNLYLAQRVSHPKFGSGTIIGSKGEEDGDLARVQVNFDNEGVKWLVLKYAKLRVWEDTILVEFDDVIHYKKWIDLTYESENFRSIDLPNGKSVKYS